MKFIVLAAALLSTAVAVPLQLQKLEEALLTAHNLEEEIAARDNFIEAIIRGVIEDFRETMLTGSDDFPVLDPFELDHLLINDEILPFPGAHVELSDLVLNQLSTFEVHTLRVTATSLLLQRYNIIIEGDIPQLDVDVGGYDLFLNALGFNLFGNGKANIKIIRPQVKATINASIRIGISAGITLNLIDTQVEFALDAFEPEITGFFNDDAASSFVSTFLKHLIPDLLEVYQDEVNEFLSVLVFDIASDLLG